VATQGGHRLTVWAGDAKVAMTASGVAEVIRAPRITRMPNGPPSLLGVTHLRGQVLPVVSLSGLMGGAVRGADRVVVLRRNPPIGLAVDGVEALKASSDDGAVPVDGQLVLDGAGGARWFDLSTALETQFVAARSGTRAPIAKAGTADEASAASAAADLVHLGFQLAGQAYALPLESVLEVAPAPAEIAALPRTEDVLLGVVQRREGVLPIVSARALLGLPDPGPRGGERLVVTRIGDQELGLVVDRVTAILRTPPDRLGPAPSLFNRGEGEARIESVLRLSDGKGLVSVLSPRQLLANERVAGLLAIDGEVKEARMPQAIHAGDHERFVVVQLGNERYGLPVAAVDEIIRTPETLTRLPKAPAYVQGVINLRGRVVPIIDQRQRFSVAGERSGGGRVVVITLGTLQAGFAVDGVASILEVRSDELLPAPELGGEEDRLFDRAVERDGEVILLIDPKALLDRAEADLLRDLTEKSSGR